jgi:hypothetical protein
MSGKEPPKDGLNEEGGCAVDWSWLAGERIVSMTSSLDTITFRFDSGQTFEVRALLWKGAPFLSFKPHAPPRA